MERARPGTIHSAQLYGEHLMFDLLWDLHQERRIGEAFSSANDAASKATQFQERVRFLEERVERMALLNVAMWSLVKEATGLTDEHLAARVEEIDLQDGVADGKMTRTPATCPKCNRNFSARHRRCLYCGHQNAQQSPFDPR
jgi:hypothetical protein